MKKTVVYFSSCSLNGKGEPDPFMLQELPWLLAHFDRVVLCSYFGVKELTEPRPRTVTPETPACAAIRARLRAPFCREFWHELGCLRRDGQLTPVNAMKLLLFTIRGFKLHYWAEAMIRPEEQTTLYAFWMSYDGFAAALCKHRHPEMHAVARGHAFDIDRERNPLNPYLMKRYLVRTLDGLYPISEDAARHLTACTEVPPNKLAVIGMGSAGTKADARFAPPLYEDGVFHLVSCASLIAIKNVTLLIEALSLWTGGRVRWLHIGGGADEADVRAIAAKKLGGKPEIEYEITGTVPREQVERIYATRPFDVFVNTSRHEGVPVSIMDAMRAGIPVVAPDVGGIPELVDDSVGRLYPPEGGAEAVLAALTVIAKQSRDEAEALRAAAQSRWNERCRSDLLLTRLFPEAAKGGDEA